MSPVGLVLIAGSLVVPLIWFVDVAGQHDRIAVFSQYLGASALIVMGWSQLLATRIPGLQSVFGGLDRVYVLHKWLGIYALVAVLLHDTVDAEIDGLGRETVLVELAETLGEISLYGFLALIVITVATFVPYQFWRWTHRFMGAFFALSAFHFIFILKPFAVIDPLGLYILGFCIVGILSYLYTLVPFRLLHARHRYTVRSVSPTGDALAIELVPETRGLRHRPGQFAFVSFAVPGAEEVHPFTISTAPTDKRSLRFTVKPLGDYTARLENVLNPGVQALVAGPYGHFTRKTKQSPEIWIAGGIGITPFVAWAEALSDQDPDVHVFYCVRDRLSAAHLAELERLAIARRNLHLHVVESASSGRLTAERIARTVHGQLSECRVAFCGPKSMREGLKRDLIRLGLRSSAFDYEEFEIRSGIGLRALIAWIARHLLDRPVRGVPKTEPA